MPRAASRLLLALSIAALAACGGSSGGGGAGDGGSTVDAGSDRDGDGLSDADEATLGTDPDNPDSDGDGLSDGDEVGLGTDPLNPDSDGDGILDGDEVVLGTDPNTPDAACADTSATANLVKQPVDIILVIDTSTSMGGEIDQVRQNIDVNLASILATADLDYRIILLGDHPGGTIDTPPTGFDTKLEICISTPLSGADCTCSSGACSAAPASPAMTDTFKQYSVLIDSHDALQRIINDFASNDEFGNPGWGSYLRDGAQKVFLLITDDSAFGTDGKAAGEPNTFAEFDAQLLALSPAQFGTAQARNYVVHSILGMAANTPATSPWLPADPVQSTRCTPGADGPGTLYQDLSIQTGGLRFPLCNNDNFDIMFQTIADGVVEGATLACSYQPTEPQNGTLDFSRLVVYYTAGGATVPSKLTEVANSAACVAGAYFVVGEVVTLCPATCDAVQADPDGKLDVHVACSTGPVE